MVKPSSKSSQIFAHSLLYFCDACEGKRHIRIILSVVSVRLFVHVRICPIVAFTSKSHFAKFRDVFHGLLPFWPNACDTHCDQSYSESSNSKPFDPSMIISISTRWFMWWYGTKIHQFDISDNQVVISIVRKYLELKWIK